MYYKLALRVAGVLSLINILINAPVLAQSINPQEYSQPDKQPYVFIKNRQQAGLNELGKLLFFDVRLSGNNTMSCSSCHQPNKYWSDGLRTALGRDGESLNRSTPTLINVGYNKKQFWDGRASSLEQQSTMPIESPQEMNQDLDELVKELNQIPGYVKLFSKYFKADGITKSNISRALAAFQRTIISNNTAFDRWYAGDESAINASAKRGFELFDGKADCAKCHSGFNFSNDKHHNIGLPNYKTADLGRYEITKNPKDKGAFKTPTVRNIIHTAPYMHNGIYKTLEEVITHYVKGGVLNSNLDKDIKPLKLSKQDEKDLIEFLKALSEDVSVVLPTEYPE